MAKQRGIIKLRGTIGDITFYKTKDGHLAREKGGVDAKRMATDPAFQRTRENGSEFGRAGISGKLLRTAFRSILMNASDGRMTSRLTQQMMKVIKADATSVRGLRNVIDGEAELLVGFEFNIRSSLSSTFFAPIDASIDRGTGALTVAIPPFSPLSMISAPSGSTHYKIISAGAVVDFVAGTFTLATSETAPLPWNMVETAVLTQVNALPVATTAPLFLILGIEFYQEVNSIFYPLNNGAFNAFTILKVDGGV
ncbi:hypothetical protein [Flavobacterium tegetincola]|uniref:hypothetical protein n=1 Tax=Flavobacterium tegetincola TaxID=150172 RepID=UPI0003F7183F|nr:hypothetical protein [Flavobacterium tegetincola]